MKIILLDLGDTLEHNDALLPGALATLQALRRLKLPDGSPVPLGLISDFEMPVRPQDIPRLRAKYVRILKNLGIQRFFTPVGKHVTLSTEVGVIKPVAAIFRAAIDKISPALDFSQVMFVTENQTHVAAANALGMRGVHFQGPGQTIGEIAALADLVPLATAFAAG